MATLAASRWEQFSVQHYAREARQHLPESIFQPVPARLLWLPLHLGIILGLAAYIVGSAPPWYLAFAAALVAGHSWACLSFLAHETLHHSVVRNRVVERVVGFCGLGIFLLSPTLWVAWHNQTHHGNTGNPDRDPDSYGMLATWEKGAFDRALMKASPGSGRKRTIAFPFVTFSLHSLVVLLVHSRRDNYYARISRRVVYAEVAAMLAFWTAVFVLVGAWSFLFIYVLPLFVANAVTMSYIATNHHLSSLTSINDPLINSLSVTGPRWVEKLHFQFGYHVEHHIFPTVNGRHAPIVRDVLVKLYGERYLTLPQHRALRLLYTRPKAHATYDSVIHAQTRQVFNTLAPGALTMAAVPPA
jgi:fatty acid desaturase